MFSGEGFATLDQRQSHEEKHDRLYRCQEQGCIYHDRGFKSKSHLRKHMKDYHTVMAIGRQSTDAVEVRNIFYIALFITSNTLILDIGV